MTLKTNNFSFFRVFFPITPKIRVSDKNGFQILHRKKHQLKKSLIFYMTLKDNNTIKSIKCIILPEFGISQ